MNKKQIRMVIVALMLGSVMAGLDGTITSTVIPAIVSALHGIQLMGWIVAIYLLGVSVSVPIWIEIDEKTTSRLALEIALGLFVLGPTLEELAPNTYSFLVAGMIVGVGGGGIGSPPYITTGYVFPDIKKRTQTLDYSTAGFNGVAILDPLVGGWLIDTLSWRWAFYINIPIILVALSIALIRYKPVTPKSTPIFSLRRALLLVSGLITFLMGIQLLGLTATRIIVGLILLSLVLLIFFFLRKAKAENPAIPLSIPRSRGLNGDLISFATTWGVFTTMNTYSSTWVQALLGVSVLMGGMTLIPNSIVEITASRTVTTTQEKIKTFTLVMIGIVTIMVSSGGLSSINSHTPLWVLILAGAFSGVDVGFIFIALQVRV